MSCDELEIFEKKVSSSSGTQEEETTVDSKYPLLSHDKVTRTLEKLNLQGKQVEMTRSGQFQIYHSPKLKQLYLSVEKSIYEPPRSLDLGWLQLSGDFEEALGRDNVAALVAPFSKMEVRRVSKLSPSLVSSSNLTHLSVRFCPGSTALMTSSIARSLTHLMHLSVAYCFEMEEIITLQEGEDDENKEIIFNKLKFLELEMLPRLKRFCAHGYTFKFFLLDKLIIKECPEFKTFSPGVIYTPSLKISDSNLNKILYQRFFASTEVVLDEYDCRMIRNDQFQADNCPQVEILHIERFVDEGVTFPYTLLERFPKLNAVHVTECSFEEIFPSHTDIADKILAFKELCLAKLDRLKNIFSSSTSFDNLTVLRVSKCHQLACLMTNSTAKNLMNLEALEIEDCKKLEEIVAKETNDSKLPPIYQKLKFFQVKSCNLMKLAPSAASFDSLTMLKVSKCNQLVYLMTNSTAKSMVNLETMEIEDCEKLEELVAKEINDSKLPPIYQKLKFFQVKNCGLIKLAPSSASFDSLTMLKVSKCHQLVNLVSNSTAKSMVNLETLEIDDCEKLEQIVRKKTNEDVEGEIVFHGLRTLNLTHLPTFKTRDDRKDFNTEDRAANTGCTKISTSLFNHNKMLLLKLEILELSNLSNNLISLIWDDQLLHSSFSNLKTLIMRSCKSLKSVPLRVLKSLNNLKNLKVSYCDNLEEVFGYEDLNDYYKEKESSSVDVPLNLTHIEVESCNELTTLMTSSAARRLVHLHLLSVSYCNQIEEIITKEEGGDDEDKEILFTEMVFLELDWLPRLERFCGYNYPLRFPLLEHVTISECPHLTIFCSGDIHAPRLHSVRVTQYEPHKYIWKTNLSNTVQHLFTFQEVISTTESMVLNAKNVKMIMDVFPRVMNVESFQDEGVTFPYRSLEIFPKMKWLYVEHSSFEEIFPSQEEIIAFEGEIPQFEFLYIAYLEKLKSIWKDDTHLPPIHQNLSVLEVKSCCNLAKLAPSSASFEMLWWLSISGCDQLIHVVTISTAKSLVSLRVLKIHDCKKMEEIVMNETNEDVEGVITFKELCWIEVNDMPSLKMFSSQNHSFEFPKLEGIKITGCPKMKMLCPGVLETPKMSKVKIEGHDIRWEDEKDLNKIIQQLSSKKDSINM